MRQMLLLGRDGKGLTRGRASRLVGVKPTRNKEWQVGYLRETLRERRAGCGLQGSRSEKTGGGQRLYRRDLCRVVAKLLDVFIFNNKGHEAEIVHVHSRRFQ